MPREELVQGDSPRSAAIKTLESIQRRQRVFSARGWLRIPSSTARRYASPATAGCGAARRDRRPSGRLLPAPVRSRTRTPSRARRSRPRSGSGRDSRRRRTGARPPRRRGPDPPHRKARDCGLVLRLGLRHETSRCSSSVAHRPKIASSTPRNARRSSSASRPSFRRTRRRSSVATRGLKTEGLRRPDSFQ